MYRNLDSISISRGRRIVRVRVVSPEPPAAPAAARPGRRGHRLIQALSFALAITLGASSGAYAVWATSRVGAEAPAGRVLGASTDVPSEPLPADTVSTPLERLSAYVSPTVGEVVTVRTQKLQEFLRAHGSPLADYADTVAVQPHWKLLLAVAFAESTLGRRCSGNNCSGIGVSPDHPSWRTYGSLRDWIVDFNGLLDRRYNDWTLEEMCGVYVQPCNPHWMLATKQLLGELDDAGIQ